MFSLVLSAICFIESSGRTQVINYHDSPTGYHSYGECQIQYPTARELGYPRDKYCELHSRNPEKCGLLREGESRRYARKYLEKQLVRYNGNWKKAISAYNAGTYTSTNRRYVDKVLREYKRRYHAISNINLARD